MIANKKLITNKKILITNKKYWSQMKNTDYKWKILITDKKYRLQIKILITNENIDDK